MSFKDDIQKLVTDARQGAPKEDSPWLAALNELAEGLSSEKVVADIEEASSAPQRRTLRLYPRHQPGRAVRMLPFWIEQDKVRVLTEDNPSFSERAKFEAYLRTFVGAPAFLEGILMLEDQFAAPVEGFIRTVSLTKIGKDDVMLEVAPEVQSTLAKAEVGTEVAVVSRVRSLPVPGRRQNQGRCDLPILRFGRSTTRGCLY